jgi:hypothetical protein
MKKIACFFIVASGIFVPTVSVHAGETDTHQLISIDPLLLEKLNVKKESPGVVVDVPGEKPEEMLNRLFQQLSELDRAQRALASQVSVASVDKKSFDELIVSKNIRQVQVLHQGGIATCGVHAVKNAMLGLHYFNDQAGAQRDMLSSDFYTNVYSKDCSRANLREDEVEELVRQVVPSAQKQNVYVLQHLERLVNLFEISNQGGVLTEESATMAYRLSLPSYTVSFVINTVAATDDHNAGAHWIAFTVKKEQGVVTDILFMDSVNSSLDKERAKYLYDLCSKDETQFENERNTYNDDSVLRKFTEKIERYQLSGGVTDEKLNSLAETTFHSFQYMAFDGAKIIQQEFFLNQDNKEDLMNDLSSILNSDQLTYLRNKVNKLDVELGAWALQIQNYLADQAINADTMSKLADYLTNTTFQVYVGDVLVDQQLSDDQIDFWVAMMKQIGILDGEHMHILNVKLAEAKSKNK